MNHQQLGTDIVYTNRSAVFDTYTAMSQYLEQPRQLPASDSNLGLRNKPCELLQNRPETQRTDCNADKKFHAIGGGWVIVL